MVQLLRLFNDAKSELLGDAEKYNTLGKLEDKIDEAIADAKSYSIVAITEGLSANVKEAFKLVDEDGTQAGATIQIYKDSALQSAVLGTATCQWFRTRLFNSYIS